MKLTTLALASAAVALMGGPALAQTKTTPAPMHGTAAGAHAPSDDAQHKSKAMVPGAAQPSATATTEALPTEPAPTISATSTIDAPAATTAGADVSAASFTNITVTNGPVPDTAENRAKYGQPMSRAGKRTAARGN